LLAAEDFVSAWGETHLIAATDWGSMELNNTGDSIAIWDSFESYERDHENLLNMIVKVTFDNIGEWPSNYGFASILM
jgi:hypothetical protein